MKIRDILTEQGVAEEGYGTHPSQRVDPRTGKRYVPPKSPLGKGVAEAQIDYQRRRQHERDVDAGKPVSRQPKNPQNDYFARRKKEKKHDMAESQS